MKPQDVALWLGLASTIGGAAIGYGTLQEKVASLEKNNAPTQLEGRLVKLETRVEDNDIGRIGKEIEQLRGRVDNLAEKVSSISIPSTSNMEKDVVVLKEQVKSIKGSLKKLGENPLL
jgi:chromosome segregation ATPase